MCLDLELLLQQPLQHVVGLVGGVPVELDGAAGAGVVGAPPRAARPVEDADILAGEIQGDAHAPVQSENATTVVILQFQ